MSRYLPICLGLLPLICCGCAHLTLPTDPAEFAVRQRQVQPIPGSDGSIVLSVDDITAGQVLIELRERSGKILIYNRSASQGDVIPFQVASRTYYLHLRELRNLMFGSDFARFEVSTQPPNPADVPPPPQTTAPEGTI